ncbi:MAG TPA: hypothetical protein VFQ25_12045 [Ktedonobacterales bacterium]|nr:hypothetical protein [Ktedonobacterales bacterium]
MRVLRVVALVIALVVLLGAVYWGWSAYAWHRSVDSYTLAVNNASGQIIRTITVHDAAKAEAQRDAFNRLQTSPQWPSCNTALWDGPPFGFTLTFYSHSTVIETVIGNTGDCRGTIQVAGSPRMYVVGPVYLVPAMLAEP